jgi:TldD protein
MKRRTFLEILGSSLVAGGVVKMLPIFGQSAQEEAKKAPFTFPPGLYTDVRLEDCFETLIRFRLGVLEEIRERTFKVAFIRVFDGTRWLYTSTTDQDDVQVEIDRLANLAKPLSTILENPIVAGFQVQTGEHLAFARDDVSAVSKEEKIRLLQAFFPQLTGNPLIKSWGTGYLDSRKVKTFYSSKGSKITWDHQTAGFIVNMGFAEGEKNFTERFDKGGNYFKDLLNQEGALKERIRLGEEFFKTSKPAKPGIFPVILSPLAAGIFAHESFGHKSEADFMIGDETMSREWTIGKKVGSDILTIVDNGNQPGIGYVPFDDEGTPAHEIFLVRNGILSGRLHSVQTAALLKEQSTGNARAVDFEFEPIVRMTTTYIQPGEKTKEQLIAEIKEGYFIDTVNHGSGMTTFTIAPNRSYAIRDGKLAEPVQISVISGNVFQTLNEIDGVSDTLELLSFVGGGCGKMDQYPLYVGFGGPYVRVKSMNVQ